MSNVTKEEFESRCNDLDCGVAVALLFISLALAGGVVAYTHLDDRLTHLEHLTTEVKGNK